jgi:hypothetical protein
MERYLHSAAGHLLGAIRDLLEYERGQEGILSTSTLWGPDRRISPEFAFDFFLSLPFPSMASTEEELSGFRKTAYDRLAAELPPGYLENLHKELASAEMQELWKIACDVGRVLKRYARADADSGGV